MKEVNFFKVNELKAKEVMKGITMRSVANKNSMITFFEFAPNSIVPEHKHPHEQITVVTVGSLKMTIGGETKTLKVGEGVVIPPLMLNIKLYHQTKLQRRLILGTLCVKTIFSSKK